ncbi:MAG TPA: hypothetical protein VFK52_08835 [Nocardioidaceae bacterium]|nr:hypothetical protein [Nocardioidaceae bacterium]
MRRASIAVALATFLAPLAFGTTVAGAEPTGQKVTVMTRNLYLGADIQRPIRATAGKTGPAALVALANANHETRAIVDETSFPVRAELIAAEIARVKPDLVGLQEVALWRRGPLELGALGVANATSIDLDYLQVLLDSLAGRGQEYAAVSVQVESDIEAPSFLGSPFDGTITDASDVRLTMRDVIIKRAGSKVHVTDSGGGNFAATLDLTIAGLPASFVRGFNWVDARVGRTSFRFVNTHLEAFSSDLALFQAQELVARAAATDRTTVLVCDCNSDPLDHSVKPTDPFGTPHSGPYDFLTGAAGFTDQWLEWAPASAGWTSGLSETVDDTSAAGFDHRIDLVLARTPWGSGLRVDDGEVTGDELVDRDPASGLWPSDHAGVVLTLRLVG